MPRRLSPAISTNCKRVELVRLLERPGFCGSRRVGATLFLVEAAGTLADAGVELDSRAGEEYCLL
jgi:hypothetical protein